MLEGLFCILNSHAHGCFVEFVINLSEQLNRTLACMSLTSKSCCQINVLHDLRNVCTLTKERNILKMLFLDKSFYYSRLYFGLRLLFYSLPFQLYLLHVQKVRIPSVLCKFFEQGVTPSIRCVPNNGHCPPDAAGREVTPFCWEGSWGTPWKFLKLWCLRALSGSIWEKKMKGSSLISK